MTEDQLEEYKLALRTQLAERRALWEILQDFIGRYASAFDDPSVALEDMSSRVTFRLEQKEAAAKAKGLDLQLAFVKTSVDRFFAELATREEAGEL
jgi:hypothetical protein